MGRRVKIRTNYNQDAEFLRRLQDAIREDPEATDDFKRYCAKYLQLLMAAFLIGDKKHFVMPEGEEIT